MNSQRILAGSIATLASAGASTILLHYIPSGHLLGNQVLILLGALLAGVMTIWLSRNWAPFTRKPGPILLALTSPLIAGVLVITLTATASERLVQELSEQSREDLSWECEIVLSNWPEHPDSADFRRLEWSLYKTNQQILHFDETRRRMGIVSERDRMALDRHLTESLHFEAFPPAKIGPTLIPAGREEQFQRIRVRLDAACELLTASAENTGIPSVQNRIATIHQTVSAILPNAQVASR